jgi:NAD(P)-dependent dehydrogenase (short-subunit alcohol dehydrogenase family)
VIETPWWAELPEPVRAEMFTTATAAGRTGAPDDVAALVALLIDSAYVTAP